MQGIGHEISSPRLSGLIDDFCSEGQADGIFGFPDRAEIGYEPRMRDRTFSFPDGFLWGTATAGHQIEGDNVDSNWWAWEQLGEVNDGSRSGRACDYWNRYREDHALMQEHGHGVFRLGLEWARIEPQRGRFDAAAIERYRSILNDLRERGIRVCLTLNHWVVPAWFADAGTTQ